MAAHPSTNKTAKKPPSETLKWNNLSDALNNVKYDMILTWKF